MSIRPIDLAEILRDQLLWELNGVRQLVYTSGYGTRIAILRETPIRLMHGSKSGLYQLKCVLKHVTDAVHVFDPQVGRQLATARRNEKALYTSAWLDLAEHGLPKNLASVAAKLGNEVSFSLGTDVPVRKCITTSVGTRLQWFTLPSIAFHKMLVYNTLVTAGVNVGKCQAFGLGPRTADGKRNNQLFVEYI